ncbi:MAG TPA: ABC transporter substrate-binding protein [Pyrinomonadaceae bacterium]|jgi:ABC-type branched-subunit amino acid transport system substrate-binding protein
MNKGKRKLLVILLLWLFAAFGLCVLPDAPSASASRSNEQQNKTDATPTTAPQQQSNQPTTQRQSSALTTQERRGKAIYLRGESPSGQEVTAMMGEIDVPASTLTCAGCHGAEGQGKTEGGVTAGNLTWQHLVKPYGHTHPTGRKHGAFDEAAFTRAVTSGVDPAGNNMLVAMPRYRMSSQDLSDLVAYLKRIETDRDPGLNETSIRVGTLLPTTGALGEMAQAMRDVLAAYFEDVNSRGGVYNRRIELRVAQTGADAAATAANLRRFVADEQIFALIGGLIAGADKEIDALTRNEEVPLIGPSTLAPQTGFPLNRYTFYVHPGVKEQARALVNFAATQPELKKTQMGVVYPDMELTTEAAASIEEQAKKAGWKSVVRSRYARDKFDAVEVVRTMKAEGVGTIFFLGAGGAVKSLIAEAERNKWTPGIFVVGSLVGAEMVEAVTPLFQDKIFLSFPTVPTDISPAGMAEYRALLEKYKIAQRHTAAQLSAFAAAKIFIEGLKLAGRDVSRERLVTALEGLYEFDTGLAPRISFGPNRRVGALGAHIIKIDAEKKQFVPVGQWIQAN